jgi:hypothetical protein
VLHGGAALGAGMASTAGAAALNSDNSVLARGDLQQQLKAAEEREAIRHLHATFTRLIEHQDYDAVPALFADHAELQLSDVSVSGKSAIVQLFAEQYRHRCCAAMHTAYRPNASQQQDVVTLSSDHLHAASTYHVDVHVSTPLQEDCTAAQMARLQGQVADQRWESGRIDATYVKAQGQWKVASLRFMSA